MSSVTFAGARTLRSASTNENVAAGGKAFNDGIGGNVAPRAKGQLPLLGRAALGNLANQKLNPVGTNPVALKKDPLDKGRGMTKQKALGNLLQAAAPVPTLPPAKSTRSSTGTRKSSESESKPMDIDALPSTLVDLLPVVDIDQEDKENPQLVGEYVNEIYCYMRQLEAEQSIQHDYLKSKKTAIKPKMRNLMVDWLVEVHTQFSLLQETLYLTVAILDRFLQHSAEKVPTKELQLVGVTAMFIASKYEEMYPPEIGDFVYITDKAYTEKQILRKEIVIISSLGFDLGRPLPLNFLRRNSKAGVVDAKTHTVAKYAMELCLVDYEMCHVAPSVTAAASLAFAMKVMDPERRSLYELWTPTLVHYSSYSIGDFEEVLQTISKTVIEIKQEDKDEPAPSNGKAKKKLRSITKKYSGKKFAKIALIPQLSTSAVEEMARGEF